LGTALGCGLIAGVFFAFSAFVMPALSRLPAPQGIAAMQAINVAAPTRWFLSAFLGTSIACLLVAALSLLARTVPGAWLRVSASALYLVGTLGVTIACNIPRNDALAPLAPESAEALQLWLRYLPEWTAWNHVRGATAFAAALLFLLPLVIQYRD
jgi:uncharacterized membrane protein